MAVALNLHPGIESGPTVTIKDDEVALTYATRLRFREGLSDVNLLMEIAGQKREVAVYGNGHGRVVVTDPLDEKKNLKENMEPKIPLEAKLPYYSVIIVRSTDEQSTTRPVLYEPKSGDRIVTFSSIVEG